MMYTVTSEDEYRKLLTLQEESKVGDDSTVDVLSETPMGQHARISGFQSLKLRLKKSEAGSPTNALSISNHIQGDYSPIRSNY